MTRFLRLAVPLLVVAVAAFAVASAQGAKPPSPPGQSAKLTFTPLSATFGPVEPDVGASQDFVLSFKNGTTSGGLTVTLAGDEAFAISTDTCTGTALSTSRTCTVTVTYTPTGYGQSSQATLTATGKKDVKPASALLSGSSTEEPSEPLVSAQPDLVDFGGQTVGAFYPPLGILYTNNATTTVYRLSSVAPTGFAVTSSSWMDCDNGLAPGASCIGNITFTPTGAGIYTGSFTTTWTDSHGGGATVATTTTQLRGFGMLDVIDTSVTELAFGSITAGTTKTLDITFTNKYTQSLQISSSGMDEGYPIFTDNFTTGSSCFVDSIVVLAPDETCTVSITFTPPANITEATAYEGLFRTDWIVPNSGEEAPAIAMTTTPLSGTGAPANHAPTALTTSIPPPAPNWVQIYTSPQQITLTGYDVDGDTLSFYIDTPPAHGTLGAIGTPVCSSTPTWHCTAQVSLTSGTYFQNGTARDQFTYYVNDGHVNSADATILLGPS